MFPTFNSKSFCVAVLLSLGIGSPALPQAFPVIGGGILTPATAPSYTGPGDVVSGATAWYGLRAYNAAYAAALSNAINVRRASDNTTQNVAVTSTGALNIASANTFAGTDATASCTSASTTVACTGASSTPHVGSTITDGGGVTQPCYVISVGTFTGGAGSVTTNGCGTVSVAVSTTFQYGLYVTEAYDQSGNSNNISQSTAAKQPQLLPNCLNTSLPCMLTTGSQYLGSATFTSTAAPTSSSAVAERTGNTGTFTAVISSYNGSNGPGGIDYANSANTVATTGNTNLTATASDNAFHALNGVSNSASSSINVDGSDTTGSVTATTNSACVGVFVTCNSIAQMTGAIAEAGMWAGTGFTLTQRGNIRTNQKNYWATP